ncbi:uncharacterized protein SCODWIG_02131 [Saccharomycodes ludwigii]|uniref:YMC020W-like alpha/beta hydrolase domain-containing protein n=1 Tax=Saccharomycodes ludwigii TaxID=36035 RepID=A0A376B8A1_9ASCO|nr:uncharacterized protein SCODWIG_02131 [Saccharomycodes ludwigii]
MSDDNKNLPGTTVLLEIQAQQRDPSAVNNLNIQKTRQSSINSPSIWNFWRPSSVSDLDHKININPPVIDNTTNKTIESTSSISSTRSMILDDNVVCEESSVAILSSKQKNNNNNNNKRTWSLWSLKQKNPEIPDVSSKGKEENNVDESDNSTADSVSKIATADSSVNLSKINPNESSLNLINELILQDFIATDIQPQNPKHEHRSNTDISTNTSVNTAIKNGVDQQLLDDSNKNTPTKNNTTANTDEVVIDPDESINVQDKNIVAPQFDTLPAKPILSLIYDFIFPGNFTQFSGIRNILSLSMPVSTPTLTYNTSANNGISLNQSPVPYNSTVLNTPDKSKAEKHLYRNHHYTDIMNPPPKRIMLIGVHGFFPHKNVRKLLGNPTGTSTKFITEAEFSIRKYYKGQKLHIDKIALEREGMVFDRVNFFYDILTKYKEELNSADLIYFVSHSQGCPVSIILLGRLIEDGVIIPDPSFKRKIGILAMAGINNGPLYAMDKTWFAKIYFKFENEMSKELFSFQDFNSIQSRKYMTNLRIIISCNVKICFIGSITDQLVPLYSSSCSFAFHPNIFRSTFIDKDSETPKFLIKVVETANILTNLGLNDHGIIKEISKTLVGPLTGGGHSKIYFEHQVYQMGFQFAWETSHLNEQQPVIFKPYKVSEIGTHLTRLPWCMRGFLNETKNHLGKQVVDEMFTELHNWYPKDEELIRIKDTLQGMLQNI